MKLFNLFIGFFLSVGASAPAQFPVAMPTVRLHSDDAGDQDDMCIWRHPEDPSASTVIVSDKEAERIFVYDLEGELLQELPVQKPGNIDVRQGVRWGGRMTDLVVVNEREGPHGFGLLLFEVDATPRRLTRATGRPTTDPNYGGCLYYSQETERLFFICTSKEHGIAQYQLSKGDDGRAAAKKVRSWPLGECEGAVADDETGVLFISEETVGVWKVGAEPGDLTPGELIVRVGEHGLNGDLEGLAIYRNVSGVSCLIVSDQGSDRFAAFNLAAPHKFLGGFTVEGAAHTDGIEVVAGDLGPKFPDGLFACHTANLEIGVLLTPWNPIETILNR